MMRGRMRTVLLLAPVLLSCRAVTTPFRYPEDLRHPDYVKRVKAVGRFAETRDASQLPDAFDLLLDREPGIRAVAHETIRSLSRDGRDFGYRPWLSEQVRRGVVARWRAWWAAGQPGGPEGEVVGEPAAPRAEEPSRG